jgi:serine/threonine-protein kinase
MGRIDKYEIIEQIGSGGMGTVYKAFHPQFKRYVAIKEIRRELARDPDLRARFEREAELLARLPPHPNIVTVRDALIWRNRLCLVMDYIEGGTLADVVRRGGAATEQGIEILRQVLCGLAAIHATGIVHLDLTASNILLDREGTPYISDFGIAEFAGAAATAGARATAKYAAPELIDPSLGPGGTLEQMDLYAVGMVAYEALLGEQRFRSVMRDVYTGEPKGVVDRWHGWHTDRPRRALGLYEVDPRIPLPVARVVERLMEKDVNERYRSAEDARRHLDAGRRATSGARADKAGALPSEDRLCCITLA